MSLNQLRKNRNAKRNDNDNRNENSFAFRFACLVCLSVCVCLSAAFVLIVVRFSAQMLVQSKGENLAPLVEDAKPVEPQPAAVTALASESSASSAVAPAPAESPPEEKPLGKLTLHHAAVARAHWTEPAAGLVYQTDMYRAFAYASPAVVACVATGEAYIEKLQRLEWTVRPSQAVYALEDGEKHPALIQLRKRGHSRGGAHKLMYPIVRYTGGLSRSGGKRAAVCELVVYDSIANVCVTAAPSSVTAIEMGPASLPVSLSSSSSSSSSALPTSELPHAMARAALVDWQARVSEGKRLGKASAPPSAQVIKMEKDRTASGAAPTFATEAAEVSSGAEDEPSDDDSSCVTLKPASRTRPERKHTTKKRALKAKPKRAASRSHHKQKQSVSSPTPAVAAAVQASASANTTAVPNELLTALLQRAEQPRERSRSSHRHGHHCRRDRSSSDSDSSASPKQRSHHSHRSREKMQIQLQELQIQQLQQSGRPQQTVPLQQQPPPQLQQTPPQLQQPIVWPWMYCGAPPQQLQQPQQFQYGLPPPPGLAPPPPLYAPGWHAR